MMKRLASCAAALAVALLAGCRGPASDDLAAVRLVDLLARQKPASQAPAAPPAPAMSEWRFAAAPAASEPALLGWKAGPGVADLAVRNGRLAGRSSDDFPVLHFERTARLGRLQPLRPVRGRRGGGPRPGRGARPDGPLAGGDPDRGRRRRPHLRPER